ncbi:MAG TPA: hypothetical protein PLO53_08155 [Candidatus Hydrogenedentes bacterium]|nr:hypothetical protein [Candidatus Hydrogenedentota bacterium]
MMRGTWIRSLTLLAFVGIVLALAGCEGTIRVKVVNELPWAITDVYIYEAGATGPERELNRLDRDANENPIPLPAGENQVLPWMFNRKVYVVDLGYYIGKGNFATLQVPEPLDLRKAKRRSLVIIRVSPAPDNLSAYVAYEIIPPKEI